MTADEAYGKDSKFRLWKQEQHMPHVLASRATGGSPPMAAAPVPVSAWKRRTCGNDARGPRQAIKDR
jgi:hypothetical protein